MGGEFVAVTEQSGPYRHLEKMSVLELLNRINEQDQQVPLAIKKIIPQIDMLVQAATDKLLSGGSLYYIGAGTSGRLAVVDASELPPTYGVPPGLVVGVIAGGEQAITSAVEFAEDNKEQGWIDLLEKNICDKDMVIGIAASGTTPYVIGALTKCREHGIVTGSIACNPNSPISSAADYPVEVVVGPEVVTGSTRMKSGTAQKLVLNMISTSLMIQLGRVEDNKMLNMQLTNEKLIDRGVKMLMEKTQTNSYAEAKALLIEYGSVKKAADVITANKK